MYSWWIGDSGRTAGRSSICGAAWGGDWLLRDSKGGRTNTSSRNGACRGWLLLRRRDDDRFRGGVGLLLRLWRGNGALWDTERGRSGFVVEELGQRRMCGARLEANRGWGLIG